MDDVLKRCPVVIETPVAWGQMDAFRHLNNTAYFRFFESARIAYFEKLDHKTTNRSTRSFSKVTADYIALRWSAN